MSIAIIDYGSGNIGSICNIIRKAGADVEVLSSSDLVPNATSILLPGVGAFQKGILHHLFLSIRSKTHQLVINKPNQKIDIHIDPNEVNPTTHIFTQSDTKFKTAGYILGVSFLVAGVVQEDANTSANLELLTGIGILAGTFIWDKYYSTYSKNLVMTIEQND